MPPEVIEFISNNGYWAVFVLIFSQEIGLPNPVPNELVMLFCGYLSYHGILSWPYLIMVALSADFIGTNILYFTFYFFGSYILRKKRRWLFISKRTIARLSGKIRRKGRWIIYIFRLTPFIRGYTSVISGLLQIKPKLFLLIAFLSAATWSAAYISIGRLLGPYINFNDNNLEKNVRIAILIVLAVLLSSVIVIKLLNKKTRETLQEEEGNIN